MLTEKKIVAPEEITVPKTTIYKNVELGKLMSLQPIQNPQRSLLSLS